MPSDRDPASNVSRASVSSFFTAKSTWCDITLVQRKIVRAYEAYRSAQRCTGCTSARSMPRPSAPAKCTVTWRQLIPASWGYPTLQLHLTYARAACRPAGCGVVPGLGSRNAAAATPPRWRACRCVLVDPMRRCQDAEPASYRGRSTNATNVLSFPGEQGELGDVILAYETVKREAGDQRKTMRSHTAHLVVHGCLHLIGHDHMNEREARRMEKIETAILADFGFPDPYTVTA